MTASPALAPARPARLLPAIRRSSVVVQWVWPLLGFIVFWHLGSVVLDSPYVPRPAAVLTHAWDTWSPTGPEGRERIADQLVPSLGRILTGWFLSAVVGISVGLAMGRARWFGSLAAPIVRFGMNLPAPALLPLIVVLFGFGSSGTLTLIVIGSLWPIILNAAMGAGRIDPVVLSTARTLGIRGPTFIGKVLLPAASPAICTGLRIGLSQAIILTVIAEMYTASSGVGFAIVSAQRLFDIKGMWAGIVILALMGLGLNAAFGALERWVLAWHRGLRRTRMS